MNVWYIEGDGELTCDTCAYESLKSWLEDTVANADNQPKDRKAARRALAAMRACDVRKASQIRLAHDLLRNRWFSNPAQLSHDEMTAAQEQLWKCYDASDNEHSHHGEYCDCGEELVEPYIECENCEYSNWLSSGKFATHNICWDGETPFSDYCDDCDGDGGALLLDNDGRRYRLRYANGTYMAGCRRFDASQALAHWGNPHHYAPESADLLFRSVLRHAMTAALSRLRTFGDNLTP